MSEMTTNCCTPPAVVWASAWTWRCLSCGTIGSQETAAVGDPWGMAKRPRARTMQLHAGEDYARGYVDGQAAALWAILVEGAKPWVTN